MTASIVGWAHTPFGKFDAETVESLVDLRAHGAVVHLALTGDPESKVSAETYDVPVHRLGGREVWHELTRNAGDEGHDDIGRSRAPLYLD